MDSSYLPIPVSGRKSRLIWVEGLRKQPGWGKILRGKTN